MSLNVSRRGGRIRLTLCLLLAFAGAAVLAREPAPAGASGCRATTAEVSGMHTLRLRLGDAAVTVRVADQPAERAAGMQWLCPESIARQPILFLMDAPVPGRFHMNNVYAPLDIAFLDADRRVLAIHRMHPGGYLLTDTVIHGALEAAAGEFERWGLRVGSVLGVVEADLGGRVPEGSGGAD